jgi:hypothetical protein
MVGREDPIGSASLVFNLPGFIEQGAIETSYLEALAGELRFDAPIASNQPRLVASIPEHGVSTRLDDDGT